jgi:hypothetical protein
MFYTWMIGAADSSRRFVAMKTHCRVKIRLHVTSRLASGEDGVQQTVNNSFGVIFSKNGKAIPATGRGGPWGWDVEVPTYSRQSAHTWRWGQHYAPAGRPLPPERFLVLISVRGWVDPRAIVRLVGIGQLRYPITSSGTEPAIIRLAAECLNKLRPDLARRGSAPCRLLTGCVGDGMAATFTYWDVKGLRLQQLCWKQWRHPWR